MPVAILLFYVLGASGSLQSIDEVYIFQTTKSLAERGSWIIDWESAFPPDRNVSRFSVLPSIVCVPFYWLGRLTLPSGVDPEQWQIIVVSIAAALATVMTVSLIRGWLEELGYHESVANGTALLYALTTMAWPYATTLYIQIWVTPLLVLFCRNLGQQHLLPACIAFALTVCLRSNLIVLVLPVAVWLWSEGGSSRWRSILALSVSAVSGFAISAVLKLWRGDSATMGAYAGEAFSTALTTGLPSLMFSFGKGLFWFAPVCMMGLCLLTRSNREHSQQSRLLSLVVVVLLTMFAQWWTWHGGVCFGPRLLLPVLPLLCIPVAGVVSQAGPLRKILFCLALLGLGVNLKGGLQSPMAYSSARGSLQIEEAETIYVPQLGPWSQPLRPQLPWWFQQSNRTVSAIGTVLVVIAFFTLAWIILATLREIPSALADTYPAVAVASLLLVASFPGWYFDLGLSDQSTNAPVQYQRLVQSDGKIRGELWVPLKGDYVFFNDAQAPFELQLGNGTLLGNVPDRTVTLNPGFFPIEIRPMAPRVGVLRWTVPGGSQYKQPISAVYLSSSKDTQRWVVLWMQWRWAVVTLAVTGIAYWLLRPQGSKTHS